MKNEKREVKNEKGEVKSVANNPSVFGAFELEKIKIDN